MKKWILLLIVILLSSLSVYAADIEVTHKLLSEEVDVGGEIIFDLTILNNQDKDDFFKISIDPTQLYKKTSPFQLVVPEIISIDIPAHQRRSERFRVKIKDSAIPDDFYTLKFIVRSKTDEDIRVDYPIAIYVKSPEDLIRITTDMPDSIVPGRENVFKVKFRNMANVLIESAELYVDSELFSKSYIEKIYAIPYEIEKTLSFKPEPSTKPGNYKLEVRAYKDKVLRGKLTKIFEVIANPDIVQKTETSESFLVRTVKVTKTNIGNVAMDDTYEFPITNFQKWMTSFDKEPQKETPGKAEWLFTINPTESYVITITTDYRPLFFTIIGIFIATALVIYYVRRGVIIKKGVFKLKDHKGMLSEIKILLHVINRTRYPVKDVKVIEILPNILTPTKEFGTLKPSKIQKGEKSSRMIWTIDELEPGEERIISYKVHPGLHIIGKIMLPAALIRFKNKEHKIIDKKSNKLVFFSTKPKKEKE